jgi:hypothetical protein
VWDRWVKLEEHYVQKLKSKFAANLETKVEGRPGCLAKSVS